ncbi:MAG: FHA domain-containing protein [Myxacorys californica WJT36-NPBG1]|nr:FHA domain-containing protein [Myxacorys californica WJT36-NPBG1]
MITLTLLHPDQLTPVQHWTFETEPILRIGRSTDNHVVLYSAVVSRYHVEVQQIDSVWQVMSLGANGTYLDGKRIVQVPVQDGMIIRLARSGPNIQIQLDPSISTSVNPSPARSQRPPKIGTALEPSRVCRIPLASIPAPTPNSKTALDSHCSHMRRTQDLRSCLDCGAFLQE